MDIEESHLDKRIEEIISNKQLEKGFSFFDSKSPYTKIIQRWFDKEQDGELLLDITQHLGAQQNKLSDWDKLSKKDKDNKAEKIVNLCKKLSYELQSFPKPDRLLALSLADPDDADCILQNTFMGGCIPSKNSRNFSSIFTALAEHAEKMAHSLPPKNVKPNAGESDARILAIELAEIFIQNDQKPLPKVIAAAICLRLPDIENPPTTAQVRDWLKTQGFVL
ncbi:MAG: hypothetical protein OEW87_10585 [Flavobacteriaceae bacterium]|nr:hypothetical protein [Flavobacteriaceae bacterium]